MPYFVAGRTPQDAAADQFQTFRHTEQPLALDDARHSVAPEPLGVLELTRLVASAPSEAPATPAVIQLSDGRTIAIATMALIGRDPSPMEGESVAKIIRVADTGRSVSKTHLAVGTDGSALWVVDRASTNGTVVTLPDGQQVLCEPQLPVRVPVGGRVRFGDWSFVVR